MIGIVALVGLSACVSSCKKGIPAEANLRQPKIGDLGGVKVSIPSYMAELIEYEGDPGWDGEKWKTFKVPQRTYDSKITSFGFGIRFPDGALPSTDELSKDRIEQNSQTTMWLRVGVNSGNIFYPNGLNDLAKSYQKPRVFFPLDNYGKLSKKEYGLTVYAVKGIDPTTNKPYRQDRYAKDVFIDTNDSQNVQTIIICDNEHSMYVTVMCSQEFTLKDEGINAEISVLYRRSLLPHWQTIQMLVTQKILQLKNSKT